VKAREAVSGLPPRKVKEPNMPVDVALREADELEGLVQSDRTGLEAVGFARELVVRLRALRQVLTEEQRAVVDARSAAAAAGRDYREQGRRLREMHADLAATLRFAFRNDEYLLRGLARIAKRKGGPDRLMEITTLLQVAGKHIEELRGVGYAPSRLEELAAMAAAVARSVSKTRRAERVSTRRRDAAFACLQEVVREIRSHGRYAFRRDPQRAVLYASAYRRGARRGAGARPVAEAAQDA